MRTAAAVLILLFARVLSACSCVGEAHQVLLAHAQFVAEVKAVGASEFEVVRVARGRAPNKMLRSDLAPQPHDCCDRYVQHQVVIGEKYWLIGPEQQLDLSGAQLLQHDDARAAYLTHLHDLTPEQFRALLVRWKSGGIGPRSFRTYIASVDVPRVSSCSRGYYYRLLMNLEQMADGNEDHFQCAPSEAARARAESAASALAVLSFIQTEGAAGRLACAKDVARASFIPGFVDPYTETQGFFPCLAGAHIAATPAEREITDAALQSYLNQMGGVESTYVISLYFATVQPTTDQMKVRVFSPANANAENAYKSAGSAELLRAFFRANDRSIGVKAPTYGDRQHFGSSGRRTSGCVGELPYSQLSDDVSVSRPGIAGDQALIYLEYRGGARAYHLHRAGERWSIDWYVELWQCG